MWWKRAFAVVIAGSLAAFLASSPQATAERLSVPTESPAFDGKPHPAAPEPAHHIAENLQIYGLPEAATRVNELLATPEGRQAYEDYGVPLVGADLQDFRARLELQRRVMPAIEEAISSPDFSGVRLNHQNHGHVEIYVQDPSGPGAKAILDRVAAGDRP